MRIRRHLSYANVTATIALLLAAGTGGAYAINTIGSRDIKNDSIRSRDLRDGRAVKGEDVRANNLGGREIDEGSLTGARLVALKGSEELDCNPTRAAFLDCASTTLDLRRRSRLLITATGGFASNNGDAARSTCEIRIDGAPATIFSEPGTLSGSSSTDAVDGFARTLVTETMAPDQREVTLACNEVEPDAIIGTPTIAVIAVTAGG